LFLNLVEVLLKG